MKERGFLKFVILVIIAIVILSYFGFDLRKIFEADATKSNFSYVWGWISYVWNTFLVAPVSWVWNVIIVNIFWKLLLKPGLAALEAFSQAH